MRQRSSTGGALILAVGGLSILILVLVLGVSFLANVGIAAYYHERLAFVAREGAEIAAGALSWANSPRVVSTGGGHGRLATLDDAVAQTVPVVQGLCQEMGLPVPSAQDIVISADDSQATVSVTVRGLVLSHLSSVLPSFINLTATDRKAFAEDSPPAYGIVASNHQLKTAVAVPMDMSRV
jgi:hypothetical protein